MSPSSRSGSCIFKSLQSMMSFGSFWLLGNQKLDCFLETKNSTAFIHRSNSIQFPERRDQAWTSLVAWWREHTAEAIHVQTMSNRGCR